MYCMCQLVEHIVIQETQKILKNISREHVFSPSAEQSSSFRCIKVEPAGINLECPQRHQLITHLFQADAGPLDQGLQSGDGLVLPQQEGVERRGQVSVTLVGDHVNRSEASVFGLAVAGVDVPLRRHAEGHEHLRDLLDELQLVGELGQLLWQLDEVIVDVHEAQVGLRGDEWKRRRDKCRYISTPADVSQTPTSSS